MQNKSYIKNWFVYSYKLLIITFILMLLTSFVLEYLFSEKFVISNIVLSKAFLFAVSVFAIHNLIELIFYKKNAKRNNKSSFEDNNEHIKSKAWNFSVAISYSLIVLFYHFI